MPGSSTTEHENSLPTILRPRPRRRTRLFFEDDHEDDNEDDFIGSSVLPAAGLQPSTYPPNLFVTNTPSRQT